MSEVAVENVPSGMNSSPSHRESEQHWVEKSIEDIADDYFSSANPFAKKIILEKKKCQEHQNDWDHLGQGEKDNLLDDWFVDASLKLKYDLKLGINERNKQPGEKCFPRLVIQGGTKSVQYREEEGANGTGKFVTWKDEFSGPFSWGTKCQQDLSIFSNDSSSSSSTPRRESNSESVDSSKQNEDPGLFLSPKRGGGNGDDGSSVMAMKDVTKRRSFGNNLLASLEERLAFDEAVNKASVGKKDEKDYQHIGQIGSKYIHAGEPTHESSTSSGSSTPSEPRRKTSENSYKKKVSKPKMPPPGPGPKPRDIPKYTDPPMYHKSHSNQPPKFNEPPIYAPDQAPPTQSIDRGRPSVEPPKQPKISKPKMEPPKPKMEPPKPKMEPFKPKSEITKPKVQPPPPKQQGSGRSRPNMGPPPEPSKPSASLSPRRAKVDKEKLLPQTVTDLDDVAKDGIPLSTSHDNITLEVKEEEKEAKTSDGAAGDGGFDFLMAW